MNVGRRLRRRWRFNMNYVWVIIGTNKDKSLFKIKGETPLLVIFNYNKLFDAQNHIKYLENNHPEVKFTIEQILFNK